VASPKKMVQVEIILKIKEFTPGCEKCNKKFGLASNRAQKMTTISCIKMEGGSGVFSWVIVENHA
jgi:hypothetical protein